MPAPALPRRRDLALGGTAAVGLALAACGPNAQPSGSGSGGSDGGGDAALRMTWWGGDKRAALTQEVIDQYVGALNGVTIEAEPSDFSSYWDKLATQTAAGSAPDIIQMEEAYLAEYAQRGALLDLSTAGLDTSGFTEGLAEAGTVGEAGKVGVRGGSNAPIMLVNASLFERAGVELPDDTTWTWDDQLAIAEALGAATEDGTFGTGQFVVNPVVFRAWLRQHGKALWTDGALGFDTADATGFFEHAERMLSSGAGPDASQTQEDYAAGIEQSLFATGRQGMTVAWSNQTVAFTSVLEDELVLMRLPAAPGDPGNHQMWLKPGMFWSVAATSAHPEAAVAFINHFLNAPEAAEILGVERGLPPNTEIRELVKGRLEGIELETLEFVDEITPEVGADPEIAPQGGSQFESLLNRVGESFMFGEIDAAAAGQQMVDELGAAIG
ncbi:ABC transporter substrate-binding protein [Brachybacterium sp. J153]|uniref:ABC transporter substrate-binding protein n=1 Tax=Brachybacterium sp. J153 TaxID=3116488 RepID=UPI002E79634F|nr:extracellular solute-binding protein [Brachybacterium sp. J153]MEE1617708.1 extracellular solute-binding protein [Brachybacterium sp. J153]